MNILEHIQTRYLLFDGAMGTMLQTVGLQAGKLPELLCISDPELVTGIHRQYVAAGSHIVTTNTFGANRYKLHDSVYTVDEVISAAVACTKASGAMYTALDMGPVGQLLEPMGSLAFEDAYDMYKEQVIAGVKASADVILIETVSDLYEARAAILAAK